jgi:hypothetical protein
MITRSILVKNVVKLAAVFKRIVWDGWGGVKMGVILKKCVCIAQSCEKEREVSSWRTLPPGFLTSKKETHRPSGTTFWF